MKKTIMKLVLVSTILALSLGSCKSLGPFFMEEGLRSLGPLGYVGAPYTYSVKYFGYVQPGEAPDEERGGKKFYYLYLWIPAIAPEVGVRMFSPVANLAKPKEGDIVTDLYKEKGASDSENYFDTYILFERAADIIKADDILSKVGTTSWIEYRRNDDSSEMPKNPGGRSYNSLLRIKATEKPLVVGLYRIGFTTFKVGEVKGSFYAEVASTIKLPGMVIAKTPEEIVKALKGDDAAEEPAEETTEE